MAIHGNGAIFGPLDFWKTFRQRTPWSDLEDVVRRGGLPDKWFRLNADELESHPGFSALKETVGFVWDAWNNELAPKDEKNQLARYPRIDTTDFKEEMPERAKRYVDTPSVQTAFFTSIVCAGLLDSELHPLKREISNPEQLFGRLGAGRFFSAIFEAMGSKSKLAFDVICGIWVLLWRLMVVGGLVFGLWSHTTEITVVFAVLAGLSIWSIWRKQKLFAARRETLLKLKVLYDQLKMIRDEICTGCYDAPTLIRRLEEIERLGAYVPSLVFGLLRLGYTAFSEAQQGSET